MSTVILHLCICVMYTDVGDESTRNLGEISLQLETSIHPGSQELEITVHGKFEPMQSVLECFCFEYMRLPPS